MSRHSVSSPKVGQTTISRLSVSRQKRSRATGNAFGPILDSDFQAEPPLGVRPDLVRRAPRISLIELTTCRNAV